MKKKGWVALDIDGTITLDRYSVPQPVIEYLEQLERSGWNIALITGRAFCFASMALNRFHFPFFLLPQNGSVALEMPERKPIFKKYLSHQLIPKIEAAFEGIASDFIIYGGYDREDRCYWRPQRLSAEDLQYLQGLQEREKEAWEAVDSFQSIPLSAFPLVKCFGYPEKMALVADRLKQSHSFEVSQIRDPFHEDYSLLLVTDQKTSKGDSLRLLMKMLGRGETVIAAGDDENDRSLLEAADIKIAMSHAPVSLQKIADWIAPPTKEYGIIRALQMALKNDNI